MAAMFLFRTIHMWFPSLNIHYAIGVDGISVAMIGLTAIVVFAGIFASWEGGILSQGVLHLPDPAGNRGFRLLHLPRPVHHVPVL